LTHFETIKILKRKIIRSPTRSRGISRKESKRPGVRSFRFRTDAPFVPSAHQRAGPTRPSPLTHSRGNLAAASIRVGPRSLSFPLAHSRSQREPQMRVCSTYSSISFESKRQKISGGPQR